MGRYKYAQSSLKRTALLLLSGVIFAGLFYFVFMYFRPYPNNGIYQIFPEMMHPYILALGLLLLVCAVYAVYRNMLCAPKIEGVVEIADGRLHMNVLYGRRAEKIELDIRSLTFLDNTDDQLQIASSRGEYVFNALGFIPSTDYARFRMEMTCERFRG